MKWYDVDAVLWRGKKAMMWGEIEDAKPRRQARSGPGRPPDERHEIVVVSAPAWDELAGLRQQWRTVLDGLPVADEMRGPMCAALAEAVGVIRLMSACKSEWKKEPGREGPKTNLHMVEAMQTCCELWTQHTGQDWRLNGWKVADRDELDAHPPVILARELIRLAVGECEKSLERPFKTVSARNTG